MPRTTVFAGATLQQFRDLFQTRKEYRQAIQEMDLKERLFNWKPTTDLERQFKEHIANNAIARATAGLVRVTSYRLAEREGECIAYLSYGGKGLRVTAEGREGDIGFFLTATQTAGGLAIRAESKREHYKVRTRLVNIAVVCGGLLFAVIPGVVFGIFCVFFEPQLVGKKIDRIIWPPLSVFLGAGK